MSGRRRPHAGAEPSGVRLMTFLAVHQAEILDREKSNERSIHLYGAGGYWAAFERSACQLRRLFPGSGIAVFRFAAYPFPVVMASVADDELQAYARDHILRTVGPDYKILTVPALAPGLYERWRGREVRELL